MLGRGLEGVSGEDLRQKTAALLDKRQETLRCQDFKRTSSLFELRSLKDKGLVYSS